MRLTRAPLEFAVARTAARTCAGLALRGPDGSVAVSIEAIAIEYRTASFFFCLAVLCLHIVLITYAWGAGEPLATKVMLTLLSLYSLHAILNQALAVGRLFRVETVRCARG